MPACIVCQIATNKYKCPKCLEPYCSLQCYKAHKDIKCDEKIVKTSEAGITGEPTCYEPFTTEDTVPRQKLQLLNSSEELRKLLHNRHLRSLLNEIDVSLNAGKAMRAAMQEPLFIEFADACLKIVEDNQTTT